MATIDARFLKDLFPDGDIPESMSEERFNELKQQHKELMAQRKREEAERLEIEHAKRQEITYLKNLVVYSDDLAQEICERISAGELLINICDEAHMPTVRRCNQWLKANADFQSLYKSAIQDRLSIFEEQVLAIADDMANDMKEVTVKNQTKRVVDPEVIARAKLRIEVRFKHLKAGRPNKWGDTSTLITKSVDDDDPTSLSNDDLERKIAEIEAKEKILKSV